MVVVTAGTWACAPASADGVSVTVWTSSATSICEPSLNVTTTVGFCATVAPPPGCVPGSPPPGCVPGSPPWPTTNLYVTSEGTVPVCLTNFSATIDEPASASACVQSKPVGVRTLLLENTFLSRYLSLWSLSVIRNTISVKLPDSSNTRKVREYEPVWAFLPNAPRTVKI